MQALKHMKIETEREEDGRWLAELPGLPGAMAYGDTRENAVANVPALSMIAVMCATLRNQYFSIANRRNLPSRHRKRLCSWLDLDESMRFPFS